MIQTRLVASALLALGVSAPLWAADGDPVSPPPATRPARGQANRPTMPASLGAAMRDMDKCYKALKVEAANPDKMDQALKDVAMMERDAAISKTLLPPTVTRAADADKTAKAESYRVMMVDLMKSLMDLEAGIAAKSPDNVKTSLDAIEKVMTKGHDAYIPKENP